MLFSDQIYCYSLALPKRKKFLKQSRHNFIPNNSCTHAPNGHPARMTSLGQALRGFWAGRVVSPYGSGLQLFQVWSFLLYSVIMSLALSLCTSHPTHREPVSIYIYVWDKKQLQFQKKIAKLL